VRDELTVPIIYVSHDRDEVDELADVVVKVEGGRVVGVDRVRSLRT
jgi:ABC-type molybdate transport system ATPase subunit